VPTVFVLIAAALAAQVPRGDDVTVQAPGTGPGATIYSGAGPTFVAAQSPGIGLSYDLAVEIRRGLLVLSLLGAAGIHNYGTAVGSVSAGAVLADGDRVPYVAGGIGYLARGNLGFDEPSAGPRREHVVLTGEGGYIFGRTRRWGQIWAGLRVLVPIATTATSGSPLPDLPWGLFYLRFML
jgi:hypothetical protein